MSMIVNSFRFGVGGGGGVGAHRYWRVLVLENQSAGSVPATSCDSLELKDTLGGSNLATTSTSALSSGEFSGSFINDYAFNGTGSGLFWVSENTTYGINWLGYDFGAGNEKEIIQFVWHKRPDSFGQVEAPTWGVVQYSDDGTNWSSAWSFHFTPNWGTGAESKTASQNTSGGRLFWRIRATNTQGGTSSRFSTGEVEFKATSGGSDLANGGRPFSPVAFSGSNDAARAFDNNNTTNYIPLDALGHIGYSLTSFETINEVTIQVRNDGFGANEGITAGVVESSLDRTNWDTEWSFTTPATWVNNSSEVRTFTRP